MLRFIEGTWLPTTLFVVPILVLELLRGNVSPPPVGTMAAVALFVVPPTWWRMVAIRNQVGLGRGAATGALCGALIVLLPFMFLAITYVPKGPEDGSGGLVNAAGVIFLVVALFVMVSVGACLGALAALVQRRGVAERLH